MLSRICLVCLIGMLEYMFVMSREAKVEVGVMGVCCTSWISLVVFVILKMFGSGANCVILEVKCLANLYAGVLHQFTTRRMRLVSLVEFYEALYGRS